MTLDELKKTLSERLSILAKYPDLKSVEIENGCAFVMPAPKSLRRAKYFPKRLRTAFGLTRWYPGNTGVIIYPTLSQVEKLIEKLEREQRAKKEVGDG